MTAPWIDTNHTTQKGFIHDTVDAPLNPAALKLGG